MEKDLELEKLFNEWKIEEEENIRYIQYQKIKHTEFIEKTQKLIFFIKYAKHIKLLFTLLYAITLKYLVFNNKTHDPYILIIYHYVIFTHMVYSRFLSSNIKIKIITNILKKYN